jgi:hypothetical protein
MYCDRKCSPIPIHLSTHEMMPGAETSSSNGRQLLDYQSNASTQGYATTLETADSAAHGPLPSLQLLSI